MFEYDVFEGVNANMLGKNILFLMFPCPHGLTGVPRSAHATRNIWQTRNTGFMLFLPSDDDRCSIVVIRPLYV